MPDLQPGWFVSRFGRLFRLSDRQAAYRNFRDAPHGPVILADLIEYTHGLEPAPTEGDIFMQGRMAGRRDVLLRFMQHCNLRERELMNLYSGRPLSEGVK